MPLELGDDGGSVKISYEEAKVIKVAPFLCGACAAQLS